MKRLPFLLFAMLMIFISCNKTHDRASSASQQPLSGSSSGGGGGGGGTTTSGFISAIGGAFRLIGGNSDSIQINFTQAAPSTGWIVSLRSSDPSVQLPATFNVPPGSFNVHPPLTSSVISAAKNVTITATLGSQSMSYTLKVFPLNFTFLAPTLQSPGNGAGFGFALMVKFTWAANVNAYFYEFQISDTREFSFLIIKLLLSACPKTLQKQVFLL